MNLLSRSLQKKGYDFPMKVKTYIFESRLETKNMIKEFEKKYKLDMYEDLRPTFDPFGYARDVLQIGSTLKHVVTMEDYWANCKDEFERHNSIFARLTIE